MLVVGPKKKLSNVPMFGFLRTSIKKKANVWQKMHFFRVFVVSLENFKFYRENSSTNL